MNKSIGILAMVVIVFSTLTACAKTENNKNKKGDNMNKESVVYVTRDISPEGLIRIYEALGVKASGRVGVKISTGEGKGVHALAPELIAPLIKRLDANIVECNTAYEGTRHENHLHRKTIREHGYDKVAKVDILDEYGEIKLTVKDGKHLKYDIVGKNINKYDFIVNLAHFKGHQMAGFGGVIKNQSIGFASTNGKAYIHSAGTWEKMEDLWENHVAKQDDFLESMAESAKAVADRFEGKIVYIAVMNNMSVDCDCNANPSKPLIKDYGILASTDPVALDRACLDIIYAMEQNEGNDPRPLKARIEKKHGAYVVEYGEKIGLGSTKYLLKDIDK